MSFFYIDETYTSDERYDYAKFLEYTDNFDPLTSYVQYEVKNLKQKGEYQVITEEHRPDLVSYNIYGDVQYWHLLMIYNDVRLVTDVVPGLVLKYPFEDHIEDVYFSLKTKKVLAA